MAEFTPEDADDYGDVSDPFVLKRTLAALEAEVYGAYGARGGGAASAADVSFTPTGTIAATDVQAAIAEVAAEASSGGGGISAPAGIRDQEGIIWDATGGAFVSGGPRVIVARLTPESTAARATNKTAMQAAIDKAQALAASEGGRWTVVVPPGLYYIPLSGGFASITGSNVNLLMAPGCQFDYVASTGLEGNNTIFNVSGSEVGYDDPAWQGITANVTRGSRTVTVPDSSQFQVFDFVRIGSTEVFDPGSRNAFCGEIHSIISVFDATTLVLSDPVSDDYFATTHVTATPSTLSAGIDAAVTTLPIADASSYRIPAQYKHGRVRIDTEEITYTWRDDRNLYGCTRAVNGTTAATHSSGATVTELPPFAKVSGAHTAGVSTITLAADAGVNGGINQFGEPAGSFGAVSNGFVRCVRTGEVLYYRTKGTNQLTNVIRGFKTGAAAAPLVDGDVLEELDGAWVNRIDMAEDVCIEGGQILGPNLSVNDNPWHVGIQASLTARLRCKDVVMRQVKTKAIACSDSVDGHVIRPYSEDANRNNYGYGVVFEGACQDMKVEFGHFKRNRHGVSHGAPVSNSVYSPTGSTKIAAGIPRRITHIGHHAWFTQGQSYDCHSGCDDITFIGCYSHSTNSNGGFWINAPRVNILGCHVSDPTGTACFMTNLTPHKTAWKIHDCTFDGGLSSSWGVQISIDGDPARPSAGAVTRAISIHDNEFNDIARYAMNITGTGSTSGGTRWTSGINLSGVSIQGNSITRAGWGTASDAVVLTRLADPSIIGNHWTDPRQAALTLTNCPGGVIASNVLKFRPGFAGAGIACTGVSDMAVTGNTVRGAGTAISLDNTSSYCVVTANGVRSTANGGSNTTAISQGTGTGHVVANNVT